MPDLLRHDMFHRGKADHALLSNFLRPGNIALSCRDPSQTKQCCCRQFRIFLRIQDVLERASRSVELLTLDLEFAPFKQEGMDTPMVVKLVGQGQPFLQVGFRLREIALFTGQATQVSEQATDLLLMTNLPR